MVDELNPLGIKAMDHLEFTCDTLETPTKDLFYDLGFEKVQENKEDKIELFSQGQVRFLMSAADQGHARDYFSKHGEGVSKMSFIVENAEQAIETAVKRGAKSVGDLITKEDEHGIYKTAMIQGFGDVLNEFVERPMKNFRPGLSQVTSDPKAKPLKQRVARIDHLTNNVPFGEMDHWVDFYQRVYGFKETRYFDIKGEQTGLQSKVVQLANNAVIIPINEPSSNNSKSQIQEFLDLHKGAGVQHIALTTADILTTVSELQERGLDFLDVPHTYYEDLPNRPFDITENISDLEKISLLADGDEEGYLLQIFTKTYIGPLFFEYIQRKKHDGFGEGNFQALFDAIERDQKERGYLD